MARGRNRAQGISIRHGDAVAHVADAAGAAELMVHIGQLVMAERDRVAKDVHAAVVDVNRKAVAPCAELAPLPAVGLEAASLCGLATEAAHLLGGATVAKGLANWRGRGRRLPSALERAVRGLDSAASLLRHPGSAKAVVAGLAEWLSGDAHTESQCESCASPSEQQAEMGSLVGSLDSEVTSGESAPDKRLVNARVERDESQHLCEQVTCVNKVTDKFAALPPFPSLSFAVNEYPGPEQIISFMEAKDKSGQKAVDVATRALGKLTGDVAKRAMSLCKRAQHDRFWALDVLERKRQLSIAVEPIRDDVAWLLDFGFLASVPAGFKKELRKALDQIFSIRIAASSHL